MSASARGEAEYRNRVVRWIEYRLPVFSAMDDFMGTGYPAPRNLNYWWNFGSLAGIALVLQILTGIVLAMHYTPHVDYAFASVEPSEGEELIEPVDALGPLSGFLGAMLGSERGGALVEWLAGHVGDAYAETSDGGLRIATYTPGEADLSVIYVELADQAYLDAPRP